MFTRKTLAGSILALAGLTACAGQNRDTKLALDAEEVSAIDRMARARCERAQLCGGPEDPACFDRLRTTTASELKLSRCTSDVHPAELNACVMAIRKRACNDEHDSPTQYWPCQVGAICASGPEEGSA